MMGGLGGGTVAMAGKATVSYKSKNLSLNCLQKKDKFHKQCPRQQHEWFQ